MIGDGEREDFTTAIRLNGWVEDDFELKSVDHAPPVGTIPAVTFFGHGHVTVCHKPTGISRSYDNSNLTESWCVAFEMDLANGVFEISRRH